MTDRDKFIESNLKLVHSCCHRMTNRGIEYDDLYSAGCVGLIKAVDNFDESRGFSFSTYAVPVILGEIKRLFRDGGTVKVGRTLKELSLKATRQQQILQVKLNREPTVGELAESLNVSPEEAAQALTASLPAISLTYEGEDGVSELELPSSEFEETVVGALSLKQAVTSLPDKDRDLIMLRYYKEKTQSQTAKELGMTQVQVSRRERAILVELRKKLG
ncbi:MAG: sigma-70 family RNA polymerase sigma factor [Clostridia bacterium]|nr:sigma-70 family RNA polymerase sigma factor [Clostridia bacterium]